MINERNAKFLKNLFILSSYYLNQKKLCLSKSFICVEANDDIFIKTDLILTKLLVFIMKYFFFKKNKYIFITYNSNQIKLYENKVLTMIILTIIK